MVRRMVLRSSFKDIHRLFCTVIPQYRYSGISPPLILLLRSKIPMTAFMVTLLPEPLSPYNGNRFTLVTASSIHAADGVHVAHARAFES